MRCTGFKFSSYYPPPPRPAVAVPARLPACAPRSDTRPEPTNPSRNPAGHTGWLIAGRQAVATLTAGGSGRTLRTWVKTGSPSRQDAERGASGVRRSPKVLLSPSSLIPCRRGIGKGRNGALGVARLPPETARTPQRLSSRSPVARAAARHSSSRWGPAGGLTTQARASRARVTARPPAGRRRRPGRAATAGGRAGTRPRESRSRRVGQGGEIGRARGPPTRRRSGCAPGRAGGAR